MKVAVIGEGFGGRVVAPVYRWLGFEVDLVSSRDADAVRRACAGPVDLVSIHSPPFLHREHVMCALDHRSAVLCEKPFGLDATAARAPRRGPRGGRPALPRLRVPPPPGAGPAEAAAGRRRHRRAAARELDLHRRLAPAPVRLAVRRGAGRRLDRRLWLPRHRHPALAVRQRGGALRRRLAHRGADPPGRRGPGARLHGRGRPDELVRDGERRHVSFDSAFATPVMLSNRLILTGDEGVMESLNDAAISVRRPGREEESFAFPPPPGDIHEPALIPWLTEVADALREGRQIAPSFEDGVAVAEAMERLRANLVHAGRSGGEGKTR